MLPTVLLSNYKKYSQVKGSNNKEMNPDFLKPRRVWVCSCARLHMPVCAWEGTAHLGIHLEVPQSICSTGKAHVYTC